MATSEITKAKIPTPAPAAVLSSTKTYSSAADLDAATALANQAADKIPGVADAKAMVISVTSKATCTDTYCKNGGKCKEKKGVLSCSCTKGFSGDTCSIDANQLALLSSNTQKATENLLKILKTADLKDPKYATILQSAMQLAAGVSG